MATIAQEDGQGVSVGRVLSRAFAAIGAHPVATIGLAFVFGALPSMIVYAGLPLLEAGFSKAGVIGTTFAAGAFNMAFAALVQGMVTLTILHREEGRGADIVDTLPPALARLLPLMLVGLAIGFGVNLGFLVLIVPGALLNTMWYAAAPAMVAERLGVIDALGRSFRLTDGARWSVFGADLVLGIGIIMLNAALKAAGLSLNPSLFGANAFALLSAPLLPLLLYAVVQTLTMAVYSAVHASFYVELRTWKEGPATAALAEVFG